MNYMGVKQLVEYIRGDLHHCSRGGGRFSVIGCIIANPSFQLCMLYRLTRFLHLHKWSIGASILEWLQIVLFNCRISRFAAIGSDFGIAHPVSIVIGKARIGNGVTIWQNVTIGASGGVDKPASYPVILDDVKIYAGSVVVGKITVGAHSIVGALSFVNKDVAAHSIVAGVPAKRVG